MTQPMEVLARAAPMLALAESVEPSTPGAAGLAYQAAELALHALLIMVDGSDPWSDDLRYRRAHELLGVDPLELHFMHTVRLRDFYANAARVDLASGVPAYGPPLEVPSADDCARVVVLSRGVVEAAVSFPQAQVAGDG
jgi:HEPN domain-containing protein